MLKKETVQHEFRRFQLTIMGFLSLLIGPVTLFITTVVYELPFLSSISESGTISNKVSPILPYCLGALALFSLSYAFKHCYNWLDTVFTSGMFVGFTIVAMQMCNSPYIEDDRVGLLRLPADLSGIAHDVGAVMGFSCMILWILLCFRKSDRSFKYRTPEKCKRNRIYALLSMGMIASLSLFLLNNIGVFHEGFPVVFMCECLMLSFGGLACIVKGGLIFGDKGC